VEKELIKICSWCSRCLSGKNKGKTEQAIKADDPSAIFTHGICKRCSKKVLKEMEKELRSRKRCSKKVLKEMEKELRSKK
jgi:hypothetical protein